VLHGRAPGIALDRSGRSQAVAVARRLAREPVLALHTSPIERAAETAAIIGGLQGVQPIVDEGFTEVDYGAWTLCSIEELAADPAWQAYNAARGTTSPPGGEHPRAMQQRVVEALLSLPLRYPEGAVIVVTHAEPIRAIVAHVLDTTLERSLRLEIAPASVTTLLLRDDVMQLQCVGA